MQRKTSSNGDEKEKLDTQLEASGGIETVTNDEAEKHAPSNLVFGYLNLFSDGVVSMFQLSIHLGIS